MSKLNKELLNEGITKVLAYSTDKKTKKHFLESVELQVRLKNYDPQRDKRFNGSFRLPHICRPKLRICVVGDQQHVDEAIAGNFSYIDVEGLKKFNKNKKLIKKWAHQYNSLLASSQLVRQIPKILGPTLNKMNKFPAPIGHDEPLAVKISDVRATVKFQLKKELGMNVAVGNVGMKPEELKQNISTALNHLIGLLKKGWQNIKTVHIKSTMGKPHQIF
eukprot:TRINITY_DN312_c0_g1_i1.p1 TRINITY_DN312_c0_g1~~TRINITY_DN312_c0_g1_i1.p1  ORF type:complete len:219 (+),score=49.47 TRINITY_DN312_c0_g1_i1:98-754(+)